MLQMIPLILKNSPFPCIVTIFQNKILLEIRICSNFLNSIFRFYEDDYDMFQIYAILYQMNLLDDAILL